MKLLRQEEGFSLIEMVVALGMVGALIAVAAPKFGKLKVEAAHAEARMILGNIWTAQEIHFASDGAYVGAIADSDASKNPLTASTLESLLGIRIDDDSTYHVGSATGDPGAELGIIPISVPSGSNYQAVIEARGKLASCATSTDYDRWCMAEDKKMGNSGSWGSCSDDSTNDGGAGCL